MTERTATARQPGGTGARSPEDSAAAGFERLYRANVEAVTSYFARRSADPHVVADLTADTFVTAITSFATFDPGKGTARSWVFGIARHVYAAHCEAYGQQPNRLERLAGRRDLEPDQVEELLDRIDAERAGRALVTGLGTLPDRDRALVELVDLAGLRPKEAAEQGRGKHRDLAPAPSCISPPAPSPGNDGSGTQLSASRSGLRATTDRHDVNLCRPGRLGPGISG